MKTNTTPPNYKGFRFPPEIISHAVWLYFRFSLSFRDVEELLAQRGISVTYETVRQWCLRFGQTYANALRRLRPRCGDTWHLDEMITDKLKRYGAAKREILPGVEHRRHKRLNHRAENSHQPTRRREKNTRRFKSAGHAQRFLSAFGPIYEHFKPRRHHMNAQDDRATLRRRLQVWNEIIGTQQIT
ncbi:MAG TPA: DDE-type integrase/transposase/recombinase [Ktedonobacteraceae bacterium]|jgi:putative transposase